MVRHDLRLEAQQRHGRDRALRRDHRRLRQLPHQVPRERRGRALGQDRTSTAASSASTGRPRPSCPTRAPATAASSRSRRPPSWRPPATRRACWACCPAWSASSRPPRPSRRSWARASSLMGRLLTYDALAMTFKRVQGAARSQVRGLRRRADHQGAGRPRVVVPLRAASPGRWPPRERGRDRRRPDRSGSILEAIGDTPLLRLSLPGVPAGRRALGQVRVVQPGRVGQGPHRAVARRRRASAAGALRPGKTIIDSSSGNTAVGLALVGRAKGYAVELVMPESVSEERQRLCRAYGARIIFTDAFSGSDGALRAGAASMVAARRRALLLRRPVPEPGEPPGPLPHHGPGDLGADGRPRSPTSWPGSAPRAPSWAPAATSTSGTPRCGSWRSSPDEPLHGLEGLKHLASAIVPEIYDPSVHDEKVAVSTEERPTRCAQRGRSTRTGLLVGHSAGAALWAALRGGAGAHPRRGRGPAAATAASATWRGGPRRGEDPATPRRTRSLAHARSGYPFEACGVFVGPAARDRSGRGRRRGAGREPRDREAARALPDRARGPDPHRPRGPAAQASRSSATSTATPTTRRGPRRRTGASPPRACPTASSTWWSGSRRASRPRPTAWVFRDAAQAFEAEPFEIV